MEGSVVGDTNGLLYRHREGDGYDLHLITTDNLGKLE